MLLSVRGNIHTMSHNCKYYMKSLKNNAVKSKNIVDLFKKAGQKCSPEEELDSSGEDSEKSSDIETNDEVYDGYHFSSLWILNQSIIRGWFSFPRAVICQAWRQSLMHIVNWIFINSQETTATTGVSNLLSKAVSVWFERLIKSRPAKEKSWGEGKITSAILFQQLWKWVVL